MKAPTEPGTYKTQFHNSDNQGTSMGENITYDSIDYEAVIPFIDSITTGIQPTIVAIEADGTSRYFDLQGRLLNGKPQKGFFIENGIKKVQR